MYGVNTPKSTPFRNDASEGRKSTGTIFLSPYLDMENISMKFMILPMSSCGCLRRNGIVKANVYMIPS